MSGERDLLRSIRFSGRYIGDLDLGEVQMNYRVQLTKPLPESKPNHTPDRPTLISLSKIPVQLIWFVVSSFRLSLCDSKSAPRIYVCLSLKATRVSPRIWLYILGIFFMKILPCSIEAKYVIFLILKL